MLIRVALGLPPVLFAIGFTYFVDYAAHAHRIGLESLDRLGFFVLLPPMYVAMFAVTSGTYASWVFGVESVPSWLKGISNGFPVRLYDQSVITAQADLTMGGKARLAVRLVFQGSVLLALMLPFAALLGYVLSPGVLAMWEAAMVIGAVVAQLLWLAYLVRYVTSRRAQRITG